MYIYILFKFFWNPQNWKWVLCSSASLKRITARLRCWFTCPLPVAPRQPIGLCCAAGRGRGEGLSALISGKIDNVGASEGARNPIGRDGFGDTGAWGTWRTWIWVTSLGLLWQNGEGLRLLSCFIHTPVVNNRRLSAINAPVKADHFLDQRSHAGIWYSADWGWTGFAVIQIVKRCDYIASDKWSYTFSQVLETPSFKQTVKLRLQSRFNLLQAEAVLLSDASQGTQLLLIALVQQIHCIYSVIALRVISLLVFKRTPLCLLHCLSACRLNIVHNLEFRFFWSFFSALSRCSSCCCSAARGNYGCRSGLRRWQSGRRRRWSEIWWC